MASASDFFKERRGSIVPSLLSEFSKAEADDERAAVLARNAYPNRNPGQNGGFLYGGKADYKAGQLIRTDDSFGRVYCVVKPPGSK